jgi:hypothetical protein
VRGETPVAFDGHLRGAGALLDTTRALLSDMQTHETRERARARARTARMEAEFAAAVGVILSNLALADAVAPGRALAIRRGKMARSFCPAFGAPFNDAVDLMERMGLVAQTVGHRGTLTTLAACPPLRAYLPAPLALADVALTRSREVLEVRASKADWQRLRLRCAVPNNGEAKELRAEMVAVNSWLSAAPVTLDGAPWWLREQDGALARVMTTRHAQLTRVFNNGTLAHGGRLFGGWWQTIGKAARLARVRIDGQTVVELDYRAMVPGLCYARLGVRWPFGGDACPYTAGPEAGRGAWKELTNAMLAASRPLRGWPGSSPEECQQFRARFGGLPLGDATAAVRRHHPAFAAAGGFLRRMYMEAMRAESDIAVAVVLALKVRGIVALPIHDAFLVREADAAVAAEVMRNEARRISGADIRVELTVP